jgi:two-component system sensor histidine kinase/response regulator
MMSFNHNDFTILIVDDVPKNIQVLGNILRPAGYKVEFATGGKQAVQLVKEMTFDLVLLDIMMPEVSGFEVCEEIRKMEAYKDIPVIFLTAKTESESVVKGFELGAQDYVTKPFEANELLARVKTHLQLKHSKALLSETNIWLEKMVAERTAELVAAKKELEELDKVKNEFLNVLNHELRTPLNGILGGLSIIKEFDIPRETEQFIHMLDVSARRLEKFSYKALDISALRAIGPEALELKEHNLAEILKEVKAGLSEAAAEKNIVLNLECKEVISVRIDRKKVFHTVSYVVENAIRFSGQNSVVQIMTQKKDRHAVCTVKDQGPGFSEYALQNLFKPFSNIRHHTDTNVGLSLYYARLVMDAHGGTITVEPDSPAGSIVRLTFPG